MKAIKDVLSLSTDAGQSAKGFLYLLATPVVAMPDGTTRTALIVLLLLVFAFVSWATRGSGLDQDLAQDLNETLAKGDLSLDAVLKRGRR